MNSQPQPAANDIAQRQLDPVQIDRLCAQRWLYLRSKRIVLVQFVIAALVPAVLVVPLEHPEIPSYSGAVLMAMVCLLVEMGLEYWRECLRERAALIQEAFDCDVLGLPWNDVQAGSERPDPEDVSAQAAKLRAVAQTPRRRKLLNGIESGWYEGIKDIPLMEMARLECQWQNCQWDRRQRIWGMALLGGLALFPGILIVVAALIKDTNLTTPIHEPGSLARMLLVLGFPAIWALRDCYRQIKTIQLLKRINKAVDESWASIIAGAHTPDETKHRARQIQDLIFQHRSSSPEVWDWLYNLLRLPQGKIAQSQAERHAQQAKSGLNHHRHDAA